MAVSWTLGPLIGGPIVSRLKLSLPRVLLLVFIAHSIMIGGYFIALLLGCPEAEWAGTFTQDGLALRICVTYSVRKLKQS